MSHGKGKRGQRKDKRLKPNRIGVDGGKLPDVRNQQFEKKQVRHLPGQPANRDAAPTTPKSPHATDSGSSETPPGPLRDATTGGHGDLCVSDRPATTERFAEAQTRYSWYLLLATVAAVFIAGCQVYLMYAQNCLFDRQNGIMDKQNLIMTLENRPWVFGMKVHVEACNATESLKFKVTTNNSGKIPGRIRSTRYAASVVRNGDSVDRVVDGAKTDITGPLKNAALPPNAPLIQDVDMGHGLSAGDIKSLDDRTGDLWVVGRIEYEGPTGEPYFTQFCYSSGGRGNPVGHELQYSSRYNDFK